ncbi:hypothetical protein LguiB_019894 [Lonicera macranthoides]
MHLAPVGQQSKGAKKKEEEDENGAPIHSAKRSESQVVVVVEEEIVGLPGLSTWSLAATWGQNLSVYDKWYQSEPWCLLSRADLQVAKAFGSCGDNCSKPWESGDLFVCNVSSQLEYRARSYGQNKKNVVRQKVCLRTGMEILAYRFGVYILGKKLALNRYSGVPKRAEMRRDRERVSGSDTDSFCHVYVLTESHGYPGV